MLKNTPFSKKTKLRLYLGEEEEDKYEKKLYFSRETLIFYILF